MPTLSIVALDTLSSTTALLGLFGGVLVLAGLAYQVGLVTRVVRVVGNLFQTCLETGFSVWRRLFSWAPWPVFLALVLGLHYFAWYDGTQNPVRALLCGLLLIVLGIVTCLAYIFIDIERVEVRRGYKALHNPVKGQELAANLVRYGHRVGIPLMVLATLAAISGFALLNQGLYHTIGHSWYRLTTQVQPWTPFGLVLDWQDEGPNYPDFLAYTLINLLQVADLLNIANSYNAIHLTYVRQAQWPASTLLALFRSFFMLVLLQQIFAAVRRSRALGETIQDYWSPHQPIHDRAALALASFGANSVEPLLRSLGAAESLTLSQREEIATVLANIGPAALPILVKQLKRPEETVRAVVVGALGQLHALDALQALVRTVKDPSPLVRQSLVEALATLGSPGTRAIRKRWQMRTALLASRRWVGSVFRLKRWLQLWQEKSPVEAVVGTLRLLLGDPAAEVRVGAIQALEQFGGSAAAASPELIRLLGDPDESVRIQAAEALGKVGGDAAERLQALQPLLEEPSAVMRVAAVQALGTLGATAKVALPQLIPLLQDREKTVREAVAEAIRQIGPVPGEVGPQLAEGLASADNLVRAQTAEMLGNIGASAAESIPALIQALKDVNDRVRTRATEALGKMGPAAVAAVPALTHLLDDEDNHINALAAHALGAVGPAARTAAPKLSQALNHVNPEVRGEAAWALGQLGAAADHVVTALERAAREENGQVRGRALLALVDVHASSSRVRQVAQTALQDVDPQVRLAAVQALGKDPAAVDETLKELLLGTLVDTNDLVKQEAARTVPELMGPTPLVLAGLSQLLQDDTEAVQIAAAQALGNLGSAAADTGAALLQEFQISEGLVREQILRAFVKIQPPEALAAFQAGMTDPNREIRKVASAGLMEAPQLLAEVVPLVIDGLKDPEDRVKANSAQVLLRLTSIPSEAVPLLSECTTKSDDAVRLNALRALKAANAEGLQAICLRLVLDSNAQVRLEAAQALLSREPANAAAAVVVAEVLADPLPKLRRLGVELIRSLGNEVMVFEELLARHFQTEEDADLRTLLGELLEEARRLKAPPPVLALVGQDSNPDENGRSGLES